MLGMSVLRAALVAVVAFGLQMRCAAADDALVERNQAADLQAAAVVAGWFEKSAVEVDPKACPGCCSSHGGITSRCASDGRVYCADGTVSPTCLCRNCGVSTTPPPPSCSGGRVWNGSACVCTLGREWTGSSCQCTGGRSWTGSSCVCPNGQTFQNGQCQASTPTCPGGQTWNGTACTCPSGQGFDGTRCVAVVMPGNVSGIWYDTAQPGHGLILEQLTPSSLFAVWYTFDPSGQQAWFLGNGAFDGARASLQNVRPQGGFFGSGYQAALVTQPAFGTLQVQFLSCTKARLEFDLPDGFGRGGVNLTRLTQPSGLACDQTPPAGGNTALAGMTGVWYDAARPGQGLVVESLPDATMFASWFTHGTAPAGGQAWFIGIAPARASGVEFGFAKPAGGRFIPNFVPGNVVQAPAGRAALVFHDCGSATLGYDLGLGFGSGTLPLSRLTRPQGIVCVDPARAGKNSQLPERGAWSAQRSAHADALFTGNVVVDVDIGHAWRGDLAVTLVAPDQRSYPLHVGDPADSSDDLRATFRVPLHRANVDGTWTLRIEDRRAADAGRLRAWDLRFETVWPGPE